MEGNAARRDARIRAVTAQVLPGAVAILAVAGFAAATTAPANAAGRAVIMGVVVGVYAAMVPDLRAVVSVAVLAFATSALFLADPLGEFSPGRDLLGYLFPIGAGALLGWGQWWMQTPPDPEPALGIPEPADPVVH